MKSRTINREFYITRVARRYDKQTGNYVYDIRYRTVTDITARTIDVAEAFGLGIDETREYVIYDNFELKLGPTDIVYITGDSGSGKSALLRELKKDLTALQGHKQVTDVAEANIDPEKPLIEQVGKDTREGLMLLSRVGLGDAFLFIRRYRELSDGQKYRFKLAKLIESGAQYWLSDEFCATLDRDTAKIVAYNIQKHARRLRKAVIAATTHTDLFQDLQPSIHIHKGIGKKVAVDHFPNEISSVCSLLREMTIEEGTLKDYAELAGFHYRHTGTRLPVMKTFTLKRGEDTAGVIVYKYASPAAQGRTQVFGRSLTIGEINKYLACIARVVIHPKYRSIGAGIKLVKETLPICGQPYVECVAVMAQYNPFLEKAGMKRILITKPSKKILEAIRKLETIGFNPLYLTSKRKNLSILQRLTGEEVQQVREILCTAKGSIRKRIIGGHKAWYKTAEYRKKINEAPLPRLAHMLTIPAILAQPKVYLFWFDSSRNPLKLMMNQTENSKKQKGV